MKLLEVGNILDGIFELNGRSSEEFPVYIRERPPKNKAQRVVELTESTGVNGAILFDKQYYRNVPIKLNCFYRVNSYESIQNIEDLITEFLDTRGKYVDFIPYWDKEFIYQVIVTDEPIFSGTRDTMLAVPFSFSLSAKPFKLKIRGQDVITFDSPFTIYNNERYSSDPEIKIYGNGSVTLLINGRQLKIEDINEHIIINADPEIQEVYKENAGILINQNNKFKSNYMPYFDPGKNEVSWVGAVSKIEVKGRWQTKL